jgi:Domain of unknown function (DUF1707)
MWDQPRSDGPMLRASDAERERTVTAPRAHHAAARLQTHELGQRAAAALAATTVTELEEHLRDVPDLGNHTNDRHRPTWRVPMILALPPITSEGAST